MAAVLLELKASAAEMERSRMEDSVGTSWAALATSEDTEEIGIWRIYPEGIRPDSSSRVDAFLPSTLFNSSVDGPEVRLSWIVVWCSSGARAPLVRTKFQIWHLWLVGIRKDG